MPAARLGYVRPARKHYVLRTQRHAREAAFPTSHGAKRSGEEEQELCCLDIEAVADKKAPRLPHRERFGVSVEWDRAHDEASSGIPGVVLTQGEHSSGAKS